MELKIKKLYDDALLPTKAHETDAGFDLYAYMYGDAVKADLHKKRPDVFISQQVYDGGAVYIHTGVAMEIPTGYVGLLFARSSLGISGNILANCVGVIDSEYRGELKILLSRLWMHNTYTHCVSAGQGSNDVIVHGQRVAQLVILKLPTVKLVEVEELSETTRGKNGHGSSGI